MPELPEVETIRRILSPRLVGHAFIEIEVLYGRMIHSSLESLNLIKNTKITDIDRKGKYLIFKFENNYALISHLRMEGKYYFYDLNEDNSRFARVIFYLDSNQKVCYDDSRKFGVMKIVHQNELISDCWLSSLGQEPLEIDDYKVLYEKGKKSTKPIKSLLLDQTFVSGLGNIYVDETLFLAKIHPQRIAKTLLEDDWKNILEASKRTLLKAIELGGSTIKSYHASREVNGLFQEELLVYGKKGQSCPICGSKLLKTTVGGRGTTYCPRCQKLTNKTIIGLTGAIGSGKSTALKILKELGTDTISCDDVVSSLYKDIHIIKEIEKLLKINLITENGDFNKELLRNAIANDNSKLKTLDKFIHPLVREKLINFINKSKKNIITLEIPLLFESNFDDLCTITIAIKINNKNQYRNLSKRNQAQIDKMIKMNYLGEEYPYSDAVTYYLDTKNSIETLRSMLYEIISNLSHN